MGPMLDAVHLPSHFFICLRTILFTAIAEHALAARYRILQQQLCRIYLFGAGRGILSIHITTFSGSRNQVPTISGDTPHFLKWQYAHAFAIEIPYTEPFIDHRGCVPVGDHAVHQHNRLIRMQVSVGHANNRGLVTLVQQ